MTTPLAPNVAFVDTETMGLDLNHDVWEVAVIYQGVEHVWQLQVNLKYADPKAAEVNGFYDRYDPRLAVAPWAFIEQLGDLLAPRHYNCGEGVVGVDRVHLAGAVVSFDEERLRKMWVTRRGVDPVPWHYHLVDVEALAAGWAAAGGRTGRVLHDGLRVARPPWSSEDLSRAVGVEPDRFDRHTALGDARWAKAVYEAVMGPVD